MLATTVSDEVEGLCQCGFLTENINEVILKCFTDNPEKINVLLLLRQTPKANISELLNVIQTWINSGPQITLDENSTLSIDSACDIVTIQDSHCNINQAIEETECIDGEVRLIGGERFSEGRVETCLKGRWGTICSHGWTSENTDVVCGQLGLLSSGMEFLTCYFNQLP